MKLYWGPHTCAIGTHLLLEEIGQPYEAKKNRRAGRGNQGALVQGDQSEEQSADAGA